MRKVLGLAVAAGFSVSGLAVPAYAIPLGQNAAAETQSSLIQVRNGCGIGWHRDFYGTCRPNQQTVFVSPPPPAVVYPAPAPVVVPVYQSELRVYNPYPPRYIAPAAPLIYYP